MCTTGFQLEKRAIPKAWLCALAVTATFGTLKMVHHGQTLRELIPGHRLLRIHEGVGSGKPDKPRINYANVIFDAGDGLHWIGGLRLYMYDESHDRWIDPHDRLPDGASMWVRTICSDRTGRIWLDSSRRSQIGFVDENGWHRPDELKPPIQVSPGSRIFTGANGKVWFVTGAALVSFDGSQWSKPIRPPMQVEEAYMRMSLPHAERTPTGSQPIEPMLSHLNNANQKRSAESVAELSKLMAQTWRGLQARDGTLWFATERALVRYNERENSWGLFPLQWLPVPKYIYEDREGRIWFANLVGRLCRYDGRADRWSSFDLTTYFPRRTPKRITSIYQDGSGLIMIGTADAGLLTFDESSDRWRAYDEEDSDPALGGVFAIAEDRKGRIWIGTGEGILLLSER